MAVEKPLLPCPFCGNKEPYIERTGTTARSCIVVCGWCGVRHESSDEGQMSGDSWNTRRKNIQINTLDRVIEDKLADTMQDYYLGILATYLPLKANDIAKDERSLALAKQIAQEKIIPVLEVIHDEISDVKNNQAQIERYKKIRRLNSKQLYWFCKNLETGMEFDEVVDSL